ncbi:DUF3048 domain-containing protein [Streptomyces sp. NPDC015127]|uniref:DUF3048 domain-containing protein n=1 Tax=Streptomyces sp. NPDC015127 TaxID=3364939 RepID=UPI0036F6EC6E
MRVCSLPNPLNVTVSCGVSAALMSGLLAGTSGAIARSEQASAEKARAPHPLSATASYAHVKYAPAPADTPVSPFTGLPGRSGDVLAVKVDNVGPARPHTGLQDADIVYVEQVEAGQSRILAVFSSKQPSVIGPVRSARESDLELLRQFGRPALAYSGSQSALKPLIQAAPLSPLTPDNTPKGFIRGGSRQAPHNLYVHPAEILAAAPQADTAKDIGFRFGPAPTGGQPASSHTVGYPAARFTFTWSNTARRWQISMDGNPAQTTDHGRLGASTVVIQYTSIRPSKFKDRWGNVSPYTQTIGTGHALVLRDGKSYEARWHRPNAEEGTTFSTPTGEPMKFAPGQVWVVLANR